MAKKRKNLDRRLFSSSPRVRVDFFRQKNNKKPTLGAKTRFCDNSHILWVFCECFHIIYDETQNNYHTHIGFCSNLCFVNVAKNELWNLLTFRMNVDPSAQCCDMWNAKKIGMKYPVVHFLFFAFFECFVLFWDKKFGNFYFSILVDAMVMLCGPVIIFPPEVVVVEKVLFYPLMQKNIFSIVVFSF